jgi:hypothetical protein
VTVISKSILDSRVPNDLDWVDTVEKVGCASRVRDNRIEEACLSNRPCAGRWPFESKLRCDTFKNFFQQHRSKSVMPDGSRCGGTTFKTGRHGSSASTARRDFRAVRQVSPSNRTRPPAALAAEMGPSGLMHCRKGVQFDHLVGAE